MNPAMLATKTKISFHFTYAAAVYSNGGKKHRFPAAISTSAERGGCRVGGNDKLLLELSCQSIYSAITGKS